MLKKLPVFSAIIALGLSASIELVATPPIIPADLADTANISTEDHPMAEQISAFLERDLAVKPSGIAREDYLRIINGQVTGVLKYQGTDGSIQNPLTGRDLNYATPHFAHCAAVLISSGYNTSPELYEAAERAMSYSVNKLREGIHPLQIARRDGKISQQKFQQEVQKLREQKISPFGAGDFFPLPLMKAMPLYKREAEAGRIDPKLFAEWEDAVRAIDPAKSYNWYLTPTTDRWASNWAVKNGTGEWLREHLGYSSLNYASVVLDRHQDNFTQFGMFREGAFCYDLFPRTAIVTILHEGYDGDAAAKLKEHMWRGAWTSLFIQSPNGELPPGFRSSGHIWNETMQVELFEIYAAEYAKVGRMREAGIFKRAAHRSFQSVTEWIRPDGTGYIVKNRYPIEAKHGYEAYSTHTNYNMLAMSQLATAYQAADDGIAENACPSEVGGFVFDLESPHRNNSTIFPWTIANAAGNYLTIIRQRDGAGYDSTGLIRVFLRGGNPRLGPAASVSPKFGGKGNFIAVGPTWTAPNGKRVSLAELRPSESVVNVIGQSPEEVVFEINYTVPGGTVTEHYCITEDGVTVTDTLSGKGLSGIGLQFPLLVTDGEAETDVSIDGDVATFSLNGLSNQLTILEPETTLTLDAKPYPHVNGMAKRLHSETASNAIRYRLNALTK